MSNIKNKQISVTTPFDFNNQRLYNLATPTGSTDATNKNYVDTNAVNYSLGTGLYSGGLMTIDDSTHFSIASGVGYIVNPVTKFATKIIITAKSNILLMTMGSTDITVSVGIDADNNVIQQIAIFSSTQRREYIVLGELYRDPLSLNLNAVWFKPVFSWDSATSVDVRFLEGSKSDSGNSISANGTNLMLDISSGIIQGYSINAMHSYENPNFSSFTGETAFQFIRSYHNGTEWVFQTATNQIEPQYYSNGTTNLQSVANNKWSTRLIGRGSITGRLYVMYPTQTGVYADSVTAKADLSNLTMLLPEEFHRDVVPLVYLIVRGGATDLSNLNDAEFIPIQSMGFMAGGSSNVLASDVSVEISGLTNISGVTAQDVFVEINNKIENLNYSIDVNMSANSGVSGNYLACNTGITDTPITRVRVFLNSLEVSVGDGNISADCFFSSDGGSTAKTWANVAMGDYLYWNGSYAPFQLSLTDSIDFEYLTY
jgi:hypothetical protein